MLFSFNLLVKNVSENVAWQVKDQHVLVVHDTDCRLKNYFEVFDDLIFAHSYQMFCITLKLIKLFWWKYFSEFVIVCCRLPLRFPIRVLTVIVSNNRKWVADHLLTTTMLKSITQIIIIIIVVLGLILWSWIISTYH